MVFFLNKTFPFKNRQINNVQKKIKKQSSPVVLTETEQNVRSEMGSNAFKSHHPIMHRYTDLGDNTPTSDLLRCSALPQHTHTHIHTNIHTIA